jgi:dihydrofolate synthase/folylpolyglutamate synthase
LSYFEFSTLAAMHVFLGAQAEFAVLEVGLGGRLDAVNVFDPDICVITPIDIDHTHWLGEDRESIGREKAGILRAGRPVVISDPTPPQSVVDKAKSLGAQTFRIGEDYGLVSSDGERWSLELANETLGELPRLAMRGGYQRENAATALVALKLSGVELEQLWPRVRDGVGRVVLPGRFEIWEGRPTVVLDVAHNRHAMATLAASVKESFNGRRVRAVVAMLSDKAQEPALQEMAPVVQSWYVGQVDYYRSESAVNLAQRVRSVATEAAVEIFDSVGEAYRHALADADNDDVVLVFGSFYTVGAVMQIEARMPAFS